MQILKMLVSCLVNDSQTKVLDLAEIKHCVTSGIESIDLKQTQFNQWFS